MRKKVFAVLFVFSVAVILSCLTINVYFPAAAVQDAANQFVQDIQQNQTPPAGETPSPGKPASGKTSFIQWHWLGTAHAQEASINITTPLAVQLKKSMQTRFADIAYFKDKGAIGETRDGILAERDLQGLPLPERAKMKQIMATENSDRMKLYMEVLRANEYANDRLNEIQRIFAKSWREQAKTGWWIQSEAGQWIKKA